MSDQNNPKPPKAPEPKREPTQYENYRAWKADYRKKLAKATGKPKGK